MISKEGKFIFIHNFKTGGTSIEKKLGHFKNLERDVQDHRTIKDIEHLTNRVYFLKMTLYALKIGKISAAKKNISTMLWPEITKNEFNKFYKFSFVRNTWARMYSWYVNVMKDEVHRKAYGIEDLTYSYEQFLLEKINHKTFSHLYFLTDSKGNIPLDFIGRFENLQKDFDKVCDQLGIEDNTLPKLLVRNYGHYTENYNQNTKDIIYNLYKEEINYFKFEYGE